MNPPRGARFQNDGGPLLACDATVARQWRGNRGDDERDPIPPGSDYERACNAQTPAELLTIGGATGLVFGAHGGTAWWLRTPSGITCLIGAVFGAPASEASLVDLVDRSAASTDESWRVLGTMEVPSGTLLLLHAASEGATVTVDPPAGDAFIEDALSAQLWAGRYEVSYREVSPEGGRYHVVRWRPAEPPG